MTGGDIAEAQAICFVAAYGVVVLMGVWWVISDWISRWRKRR